MKILWAPNGERVLSSYPDGNSLVAAVLDLTTGLTERLGVAIGAERCTWTRDSLRLYCGGRLEGDPADSLLLIDLRAREIRQLTRPVATEPLTIRQARLSPAEDFLFFINNQDGQLYGFSLLAK